VPATSLRKGDVVLVETGDMVSLGTGGNLFYLSKILGHTSIRTTERYLQSAGIEDLKAVAGRLEGAI